VYSWTPAKIKGWQLIFNTGGMSRVEPTYANIAASGDPSSSVHGIASLLDKEGADHLFKQEGGGRYYLLKEFDAETYDGRNIKVKAFVNEKKRCQCNYFISFEEIFECVDSRSGRRRIRCLIY